LQQQQQHDWNDQLDRNGDRNLRNLWIHRRRLHRNHRLGRIERHRYWGDHWRSARRGLRV
jgi:hypothetical protein